MPLRITTWNVNGIRNPFSYQPWLESKTFQAMFDILEADIVVMQETKIQRKDLRDDMVLVPGWDVYFSLPKHKKGYSGVAIYVRNSKCCPIRAEEGITGVLCPPNSSTKFRDLPVDQQIGGYPKPGQLSDAVDELTLDSEGRCVILEFPAFVLVGVYSPATRDETRTEFRQAYIDALDIRVRNLVAMGKQVFLCGDLNIIRSEMDTAGLIERLRKEGMTLDDFFSTPSRKFMNQIVFGGRVVGETDAGREQPILWDLCREFHPDRPGMYTCWETRKNARPGNFGSRIDYVLCSSGIKSWFVDANIQEGLLGSDHCPVYATISDTVDIDGASTHITDVMNPPGMFLGGKRQREWSPKDLLPTSAKLIPEFSGRRSIRDMFFKKPAVKPDTPTKKPAGTGASNPRSLASTLSATSVSNQQPALASHPPSNKTDDSVPNDASPSKSQPVTKRQAEAARSPIRPQKKAKSTLTREPSVSKFGTGASQSNQSSLTGFFKPKTPAPDTDSNVQTQGTDNFQTKHADPTTPTRTQSSSSTKDAQRNTASPSAASVPDSPSDGRVFDPIENKESWSKLLGKRVLPKCEHGEDCQMLVTKKAGVNCGRSFFMCSRPLGPSGDKEEGTEFRCRTFIWSSEWTSSRRS